MLLGPCVINSRSAARLCGNTTRSRLRASITRCRWLATENQAGPKGLVQGTVGENLTGALSGLFQGSAGVGAGIVLVAGLTRFAGLSHMAAAGTSMPVSGIANAAGVASVLSADASLVHWPTMVCISGPALGGVLVGVRVASYMSDAALKLAFAALVLLLTPPVAKRAFDVHAAKQDEKLNNRTAPEDGAHGGDLPALLRGVHSPATSKAAASGSSCGTQVGSTGNDDTTSTLGGQQRSFAPSVALSSRPFEFEWPQHPLLHGICGTGVGLLSGTVGVGGGPLVVAFLAALPIVADWIAENVDGGEPADGDEHAASSATGCEGHGIRARQVGPTTNAILLPMMVSGTFMHWKLGNVRWNMIPRVGLFTAAGAAFGGSVLAVNAPEELLLGGVTMFLAFTGLATGRASLLKLLRR